MTQPNRPPKLYITSTLLEEARDEGITGATAYNTAHEVINRGSEGRLRGLSVSRLVLHNAGDIDNERLTVFRVNTYENVPRFETSPKPGIHPQAFIEEGKPEAHTLVVPIKEFVTTTTAWSLHHAAARYANELGLPAAGEEEMRAPTEGFGIPALDQGLDTVLHLFGGIVSRAMPAERRESAESLAAELREGINPILGRGVEAIKAVNNLPDDPNAAAPQPAMTPAEMAKLIMQQPPIVFHEEIMGLHE